MPLTGTGQWARETDQWAEGLPPRDSMRERRAEIRGRCAVDGSDVRLMTRMVDAVDYAKAYVQIENLMASHKGVEMLRTLEGLRPEIAAGVRLQVLRGEMTRAQVKALLDDAQTAATVKGPRNTTLGQVVDRCIEEAQVGEREEVQTSTEMDSYGELLGISAYIHDIVWDEHQGQPARVVVHRWALIVSPHLACSRIEGLGGRGLLQAVLSAAWSYPRLSIYCSSDSEQRQIKREVSRFAPRLEERSLLTYHSPS